MDQNGLVVKRDDAYVGRQVLFELFQPLFDALDDVSRIGTEAEHGNPGHYLSLAILRNGALPFFGSNLHGRNVLNEYGHAVAGSDNDILYIFFGLQKPDSADNELQSAMADI